MQTVKYETKKGEREAILVDMKTDNCPVCDRPLSEIGFSWNIFHGEASASCCGAPYQLKDYYIDDDQPQSYKDFVASLGKPLIQCVIDGKYLEAYRQAFAELGIRKVGDSEVHKRVGEILGIKEDA